MTDTSAVPRSDTDRRVVYPSAAVRSVPSFVFTGPDGWTVDEGPGAVVVLRSPQQADGSTLDAVLRHDRVAATVSLEDAAKATWARIQRASPDATLSFERVAAFGPNVAYLRGFSFGASGATIAGLHALLLAPTVDGRKTGDLFQLTMTGPAEALREHGQEFVDMVATFRFL
jgi:hypothetical protein